MDKYKDYIALAFKEYLNHCYGLYATRKTHKRLLSITHFHMIDIAYNMILDGLY